MTSTFNFLFKVYLLLGLLPINVTEYICKMRSDLKLKLHSVSRVALHNVVCKVNNEQDILTESFFCFNLSVTRTKDGADSHAIFDATSDFYFHAKNTARISPLCRRMLTCWRDFDYKYSNRPRKTVSLGTTVRLFPPLHLPWRMGCRSL